MSRARIDGIGLEGAGVIAVLGIAALAAYKFGLFPSRTAAERDSGNTEAEIETGKVAYWNGYFWHDKKVKTIITQATADAYAKTIEGTDDSAVLLSVFKNLKAKSDLSRLAERYQAVSGKDLYTDLKRWANVSWQESPLSFLFGKLKGRNDIFSQIVIFVKKLPDFR